MAEDEHSYVYVFYRDRPFAAFIDPDEAVKFMKSKLPYAFLGVGIVRLELGDNVFSSSYVYLPDDFIKEFG